MRIMFVCTGNICRSPAAEYVLRSRLARSSQFEVESSGTNAVSGMPMTEESAALARENGAAGIDLRHHTARRLNGELLETCDLILTMTRDHRRQAVGVAPRKLSRTFTVREFAALLGSLGDDARRDVATPSTPRDRWARLVEHISSIRYASDPVDVEDIADPLGRGPADYQAFATQLLPALAAIESALYLVDTGVDAGGSRSPAS